jgi:hypothetical protein
MRQGIGSTEMAHDIANRGSRFMHTAADSAADLASEMSHSARMAALRGYKQSREALTHGWEDASDFVVEQPIRTTLLAVGVCCLVCAMFIRR